MIRRRARGRGAVLAVASPPRSSGTSGDCQAATSPRKGFVHGRVVVVEPASGGPVPIYFDGAISGLDALSSAGADPLNYGFAGQGQAVCKLFGVGDPADCRASRPGGQYWAYYRAGRRRRRLDVVLAGGARHDGRRRWSRDGGTARGQPPGFARYCAVVGCGPAADGATAGDGAARSTSPPVSPAGDAATPPAAAGDGHRRPRRRRPRRARAATSATDGQTDDDRRSDGQRAGATTGRRATVSGRAFGRRRLPGTRGARPRGGDRLGQRFRLAHRRDRGRRGRGARCRHRALVAPPPPGIRARLIPPVRCDVHGDAHPDLRSGQPREPRRQRLLRPVHRARAERRRDGEPVPCRRLDHLRRRPATCTRSPTTRSRWS